MYKRDRDKDRKTQHYVARGSAGTKQETRESVGLDIAISRHIECVINSLYNEIELCRWFWVVLVYINWSLLLNNLFMGYKIAQWLTMLTIRDDDSFYRKRTQLLQVVLQHIQTHKQKILKHNPYKHIQKQEFHLIIMISYGSLGNTHLQFS